MAYSRYYRYKLLDSQKKLYDELLSGMIERKHVIQTGNYNAQDIRAVLYALNFDNPQLYYVDFSGIRIMKTVLFTTFLITYNCDEGTQKKIDTKIKAVTDFALQSVAGQDIVILLSNDLFIL